MNHNKTTQLSQDEIRQKLARVQKNPSTVIVQEVAEQKKPKKMGRKSYAVEGVEYTRLGVKVPVQLKKEMIVAMVTTHDEYKSMDVFVAEAIRVFLSIKR